MVTKIIFNLYIKNIYMNPSDEQQKIIDEIGSGHSVIVNAVAGSGKTTTLLMTAIKFPHKKILQITYNKQLKIEVKNKTKNMNIKNIDVQTYNSLAVKFYDDKCYDDIELTNLLKNCVNIKYIPSFDIIFIDETQDMTPMFYEFIYKFMYDSYFKGIIIILGDSFQSIYEFKNADVRFLLLSHKLWNVSFMSLSLQQSYRLTKQIVNFINKIMIGYERIITKKKSNNNVIYYKMNPYKSINIIYDKIKELLKNYLPSDFFILSPSLKGKETPCKALEKLLVTNNIPVYFTRNEESGFDDNLIANKIVFTTYHQAKGRERRIVIVFGFDASYTLHINPDKNKTICPSELYVAVTRSSEILILVENQQYGPPKFLKKSPSQIKNYSFVTYITTPETKTTKTKTTKDKQPKNTSQHDTTVKDLTAYLSEITISSITPLIRSIFKKHKNAEENTTANIPLSITTKNNLTEDVSDLNGIVIPAIYEEIKNPNKKSTLRSDVESLTSSSSSSSSTTNKIIKAKLIELDKYTNNIQKYLLMGNIYVALNENIYSKLKQIDDYTWLTQDMINICIENLSNNVKKNTRYEQIISENSKGYYALHHEQYGIINICGRIDAYDDDNKTLWEFKCVSNLTIEHFLQLIIYSYLWNHSTENCDSLYKLLNIRTGEMWELIYDEFIISTLIELLLINKYGHEFCLSDDDFLNECELTRKKYSVKKTLFDMFDDDE